MATKTISIDVEAYNRLRAARKENESFSETIKRVVRKPADVEAWLKAMEKDPLSEATVATVERVVAERRSRRNVRPPASRGGSGKGR